MQVTDIDIGPLVEHSLQGRTGVLKQNAGDIGIMEPDQFFGQKTRFDSDAGLIQATDITKERGVMTHHDHGRRRIIRARV